MIDLPYNEYKLENLNINCIEMTISNHKQSIKLPVKVFEFFKLFIKDNNQTVNRDLAIEILWGGNYPVGKRGYTNAMCSIRKVFDQLGADSKIYFRTLPKVGYKLEYIPEAIVESNITADTPQLKLLQLPRNQILNNLSSTIITRKRFYFSTLIVFVLLIGFINLLTINLSATNRSEAIPVKITNLEGIEEQPSISSDGRYLAFRWLKNQHNSQIYIKDLKDNQIPLRLLTSDQESEVSPSWSPSGHSLVYLKILKDGNCQVRLHQLISNQDSIVATGCFYNSYSNGVNWSPDGRDIVYSKRLNKGAALFKYNFAKKTTEQISFPKMEEKDISAVFSGDSKQVAFIRENRSKTSLMLLDNNGRESTLLANKLSITGLAWDYKDNNIYTNVLTGGAYQTNAIDPITTTEKPLQGLNSSGNLTINYQTSELFYSKHVSQEYISHQSFVNGKEIQRISSSSRDLYGQYINNSGDILFVSNRSNEWDLWLKTEQGSKNLTNGIGAALMHRASPTGQHFVVSIKHKLNEEMKWYMGELPKGKLTPIELGNLKASSMTWSVKGDVIYFSSDSQESSGIYKLNIHNNTITQLTFDNEKFALEGPDGNLYMSKEGENGIWKYDQKLKTSRLYIKDLAATDFGNYFWQGENLYYLHRNIKNDQIKRLSIDGEQSIIATYPAGMVRIYFGIAAANDKSFLLTLKSINDADIYSYPLSIDN